MFRGERERQRPPVTSETYANGRVKVVHPHDLDREVHVVFDDHSQFVVRNFTQFEGGLEGEINKVELRKYGHHRLICELVRTGTRNTQTRAGQKEDIQYVYEVHSPHGLVGTMTTASLQNLDLAFAGLFVTDNRSFRRKVGTSKFTPDESVKAFIQITNTAARAHRNNPSC